MGFKLKTVLATVWLSLWSSSSARVVSPNTISSVLQERMSQTNTDKAMQLINMAATRANKNIAIPDISRALFATNDCGGPARAVVARNEMGLPRAVFGSEMGLPRAMIASEMGLPRAMIASEMGLPRAVFTNEGMTRIASDQRAFNPEIVYQTQPKAVRQIVREGVPADLIDTLILPKEVYQTVSLPLERQYLPAPAAYPCLPAVLPTPNSYSPFGAPNPYLPAASPMSAMSSVLIPPTQSKGQFLRKIPIPPPSL